MPSRNQFESNEQYNEWFREYRKNKGEKYRKWHREYNKLWREKYGYENEKRWKERNEDKVRVERMVQWKIRAGFLKRLMCCICGNVKSQAHHPDYSKPYDVIWLCALHHTRLHREISGNLKVHKSICIQSW